MSLVRHASIISTLSFFAIATAGSLVGAQPSTAEDAPDAPSAAAPETAPTPAPVPAAAPEPTITRPKVEDRFAVGVYFNPIAILLGFYGLELDFSPEHFYSINISGSYYSKTILDVKTEAYGGDIGVQLFLTGEKPMYGAYIYPRIAYMKAKASFGDAGAEANLIGLGVTGGYQWNWEPFSFRIGGGLVDYLGSAKATGSATGSVPEISLRGISPAIDLTMGFVF